MKTTRHTRLSAGAPVGGAGGWYDAAMLWQRLILGPAMIALLLAVLYVDDRLERLRVAGTALEPAFGGAAHPPGGLAMLALLVVAIALAGVELARLFRAKGIAVDGAMAALAAVTGLLGIYAVALAAPTGPAALAGYGSVLAAVLMLAMLRHCRGARTEGVIAATGATLFALLYLGTLPGFYLLMRQTHPVWLIAGALLVIKACDIGAYFAGRALGRHKLIPWLSPGKTWEGLAGGMALAAASAVALAALGNHLEVAGQWVGTGPDRAFEPMRYSLAWAAVAGVVLGGVGHLGDLAMSLLKRDAGAKDSGRTIPGFGGVLDVTDSLIIAAPFAYWLSAALVQPIH